jgi:hypothetical protein
MALNTVRTDLFNDLIRNHKADQKRESLMGKGVKKADIEIRNYRISVMNRALGAVAIPIFVWLVLETFFK